MTPNEFKNIIYHCKPHNRFVIYNSSESDLIKSLYSQIFTSPVVISNTLEIKDGDLVWIDTFGIKTDMLIDRILEFTSGNFFEIICNELLETYLFSKHFDTKDRILEGKVLKRKGETRHFLKKEINNLYLYSPLKLWSSKLDLDNFKTFIPEDSILDTEKIINLRQSQIEKSHSLQVKTPINTQFDLIRAWCVWGNCVLFEVNKRPTPINTQAEINHGIDISCEKFLIEPENMIFNLESVSSQIEDFSSVIQMEFYELDFKTNQIKFFGKNQIDEWANNFLINYWRHGFLKIYYPQFCN